MYESPLAVATLNAPYLLFGSLHLQKTGPVASVVQVSLSMKEGEGQKLELYQEMKGGDADLYPEHIKVCHNQM